jgi:hypothetical protein
MNKILRYTPDNRPKQHGFLIRTIFLAFSREGSCRRILPWRYVVSRPGGAAT